MIDFTEEENVFDLMIYPRFVLYIYIIHARENTLGKLADSSLAHLGDGSMSW